MNRIRVGDLAYLPSNATLLQYSHYRSRFCRTKVPRHVLVLENDEGSDYYTILYDGNKWSAYKRDLYPIVEKEIINNGS